MYSGFSIRGERRMKNEQLLMKEAIINYLKTHKKVDSPEVVSAMALRCDLTLIALKELEAEGIVERCWNGRYYQIEVNDVNP